MINAEEGLRGYARMINRLDSAELEPLLANDFTYESQTVITPVSSKAAFLEYINEKLAAIRNSGSRVWAEMGWLDYGFPGPCVIVAQGSKDNLVALVLAKIRDDQLLRLDMCVVPPPSSARRSGEYPGLAAN